VTYKRQITPEAFGAVGDGIADDGVALQAWLDSTEGATVNSARHLVARGQYKFTNELLLAPTGSTRVTMDFQGARFNYAGVSGIRVEGLTLTFDAAGKTITRSAGSFITDGFTAGRKVFIYGSSLNDKLFKVSSVTALVLTLDPLDILQDEGPVSDCRVEDYRNLFTLGDPYNSRKLFWSRIEGLFLGASTGTNTNALLVHHADFLTVVSGSIGAHGRALFLCGGGGGPVASSANSAAFHQVTMTGGYYETALMMGNVWSITGNRNQQSQHATAGFGIHAYKCSVFEISNVDFSLHKGGAVKINKAGNGKVHFYSESIGTGVPDNDTKVIHAILSNNVQINATSLNCAQGGTSSGNHTDYGMYLESCYGFQMHANGLLPMKAFLFLDSACGPNELMFASNCDHKGDDDQTYPGPIIDNGKLLKNSAKGKFLTPVSPSAVNHLDPDLSNWTYANGAVYSGSTVPSDDLSGTVNIIELDKANIGDYSSLTFLSSATTGAPTKGIRIRLKSRFVAFRDPPTKRMAILEILIRNSANYAQVVRRDFRIGDNWDWHELTWFPPADSTFDVFINPRESWEPVDIAIESIGMIVE